jgi:predicted nucleic acid-binding Zn ribbon protein
MKYVRLKSGDIDIMEDGDSIPAGAETIFSTDPAVYEGTWDKPVDYVEHADVVMTKMGSGINREGAEAQYGVDTRLGTQKPGQEKVIEALEKGHGGGKRFWSEPHKAHPKDKVCLNCGKKMEGARPNRKFCSEKCRNTYGKRQRRAKQRTVKSFKPHMGKEGQIFYMYKGEISFIPSIWCDSLKRAEKYIKERYNDNEWVEIMEQIKEAMKNGK